MSIQEFNKLNITSPAVESLSFWVLLALLVWVVVWLFPSISYIFWRGYFILFLIWTISIIVGWIRTEFV
jgi:hypothetical protein